MTPHDDSTVQGGASPRHRLLLIHNRYQREGGEDAVFELEAKLLAAAGHRVETYTVDNRQLDDMSRGEGMRAAVWNHSVARELDARLSSERPDLVHIHNWFPLLSPAAFASMHRHGIPLVATQHNFRLTCLNGMFLRDGAPCELCLGKSIAWPGVMHGCYRGSRAQSLAAASVIGLHHVAGNWRRWVDRHIAMSEFARTKLATVIPPERIVVKPNAFEPDPGVGPGGDAMVFVGRLAQEKGLEVLLEAWRVMGERAPELRIVGDGPLAEMVDHVSAQLPAVTRLGHRSREEVLQEVGSAAALVQPSVVYEGSPRTVIEAFARGTPAIVSGHGGLGEAVTHGGDGWHVTPGDPWSLADRVVKLAANRGRLGDARAVARSTYERRHTGAASIRVLEETYADAIAHRASHGADQPSG